MSVLSPIRLLRFFFFVILSASVGLFPAHAATWQADFSIRVLSPKVKEISTRGAIYRKDFKIRIEPSGSTEVDLYDFEQSLEMRIFPADQIYFVSPLPLSKRIKGMKEAWVPPLPPFKETRILFKEDLFQGKTAKLYFVILERSGQKAYLFRWIGADPEAPPLRVIYSGTARETIIVDFTPRPGTLPSADYFNPPSNYLSLNPF